MESTMTRLLGRSGIAVSAMGLGCWAIGGPAYRGETPVGWGEVDDNESIRAIQRAVDLGVTFFDTANVYGAGHSEEVLGRALKDRRHEVAIATKFGNGILDQEARQIGGAFATPADIKRQCEESLRRMNIEVIDLFQFHQGSYPIEPVPYMLEALEELVLAGKIRAYGWSTDSPLRAIAFSERAHCSAVQFQLNVLDDNPDMITVCEDRNLAGINRGPLAMGLLTGKFTSGDTLGENDVRGIKSPDWMKYFKHGQPNPEWYDKVKAMRDVLTSGGRTLAQGALAWIWARSPKMIPIPGFRTVKQVEENAAAMRFGPLNKEQMAEIESIMER